MTVSASRIFRLNDQQVYEICELLLHRKIDIELRIKAQPSHDLRLHNELNLIIDLLHKLGYTFIG